MFTPAGGLYNLYRIYLLLIISVQLYALSPHTNQTDMIPKFLLGAAL